MSDLAYNVHSSFASLVLLTRIVHFHIHAMGIIIYYIEHGEIPKFCQVALPYHLGIEKALRYLVVLHVIIRLLKIMTKFADKTRSLSI